MKIVAVALVAFGALSGCVVYPVGGGRHCYGECGAHYGAYRSDRDGDGVADRYDRHPDNPRRA